MKICDEALAWLGTPYHHQARIKGIGVDCAMLLCEVFEACEMIPHVDPRPYPPDWHFHRSEEKYLKGIMAYADELKPDESPQAGDIVLYKFGRCISHAGIVLAWPQIIHAYRGQGVVLAEGDRGELGKRLAGFWRIRDMSNGSPIKELGDDEYEENEGVK